MIRIFHLPKKWQYYTSIISDFTIPLLMIMLSFLCYFLPIQFFFPAQATPDIPIIILFGLLLHRYSSILIPLFFLFVSIFEYVFFIPTASLMLHYFIFTTVVFLMYGKFLNKEISFNKIYLYFSMSYITTLLIDYIFYIIIYKGYLSLLQISLFWLSAIMIFPAIFYICYYLILANKTHNQVD